jgi:hypothetical protein
VGYRLNILTMNAVFEFIENNLFTCMVIALLFAGLAVFIHSRRPKDRPEPW